MVAGLWLLQLDRVWYNLPVLFLGFSAFFSPAAWVTSIPGSQEGSRVLGRVATPSHSPTPHTSQWRPEGPEERPEWD